MNDRGGWRARARERERERERWGTLCYQPDLVMTLMMMMIYEDRLISSNPHPDFIFVVLLLKKNICGD